MLGAPRPGLTQVRELPEEALWPRAGNWRLYRSLSLFPHVSALYDVS